MKSENISVTTEVKEPTFFMPPPLPAGDPGKKLVQWFMDQARLCSSQTAKAILVFKIYKTPDKNYAIYLAFVKRPQTGNHAFDYLSSVGHSFKLPEIYKPLTDGQLIEKVTDEYFVFAKENKKEADIFELAKEVNLTYDNFHIVRLGGK